MICYLITKTVQKKIAQVNLVFLGIHSVWGNICVEKFLSNISGEIFFVGGGNLISLIWGKFIFGGFFQFGQFCVWEILNLYFGVKFFLL